MNKIEELEKMLKEVYATNNVDNITLNELQNKLSEVAKVIYTLEEQNKENVRQVQIYKDDIKSIRSKCDLYVSMIKGVVDEY